MSTTLPDGLTAPVPADVVRALDALQAAAREAPDMAAFRQAAGRVLEGLPEASRKRLLEAAPLLADDGAMSGAFLLTAPEPGLPPEIRAGDTLVVDPAVEPRAGDAVVVGTAEAVRLVRWAPGAGALRGVVVEVRRRLR
ncbi:MAG TPA: hypothetical protein VFS92_11565 [Planctomycetota bacterium]|nr:hypothetical protein [Planctomycetota bacterium]